MESVKVQAYIDTRDKLTQQQITSLNEKLSTAFEEFALEISKEQLIDIGWSWWNHMNII